MTAIKSIGKFCAGLAFFVTAAMPTAADPFVPTFEELAPGIWAGVREDNPRFPVMGTTTFVISEDGVVVFDGGGAPLYGERVIEKIRSLTDRPVTHVVISHWHGDHNFGIEPFRTAFPAVQVITHSFTQEVFEGEPIKYIEGFKGFMPGYKKSLQDALDSGLGQDGEPMKEFVRAYYERILADADVIEREYERAQIPRVDITIDGNMTIHSGTRRIELLFLGIGNTAGDIVMWLPDERIVASGDIVVHPIPYAFNVDPASWADTLRALKALDYRILVPGHGDILHDTAYIDLLIETAEGIAAQRDALLAQGLNEEEAKAQLDYSPYEPRFTGGSEYLAAFYGRWFKQPFSNAVFKALKGVMMVDPAKRNQD